MRPGIDEETFLKKLDPDQMYRLYREAQDKLDGFAMYKTYRPGDDPPVGWHWYTAEDGRLMVPVFFYEGGMFYLPTLLEEQRVHENLRRWDCMYNQGHRVHGPIPFPRLGE